MLAYSGKGRFVVTRLDLNAVVKEMTALVRVSPRPDTIITYHLVETLPPVEADATQIRQIVMNLVVNASAAGDSGGVIRVSTGVLHATRAILNGTFLSPDLPEGEYVFVEVSDNGVGMNSETRSRIFDPFFTTKFTGRGLGLAAVLGIVRGHKGAIRVESELGAGATFTLLLPTAAPDPREQLLAPPAVAAPWKSSGVVLVVDDEETVRMVTGRALRLFGFEPLFAVDGQEGVEFFRKHQDEIVCILLDMTMPRLDGEGTFKAIRAIRPDARVILTSGYSEHDATARFIDKGLAGFIQKPYDLSALRAAIRAALEVVPAISG